MGPALYASTRSAIRDFAYLLSSHLDLSTETHSSHSHPLYHVLSVPYIEHLIPR